MKITTVKELKKFLENFDGNTKITFTDDSLEPAIPWTFEIHKIEDLFNKYVDKDCIEDFKETLTEDITTEDIVIYAEF